MTNFSKDTAFAVKMDAADPLASFRQRFHIPRTKTGKEAIYLCGNSLGLQPVAAATALQQEMDDWKNMGIDGYFNAKNPWVRYQDVLKPKLAEVVGAKPDEVAVMHSLTTNLHLMMVSFYRPTAQRHKILIEEKAFPSDQYAVKSQIAFHGFDPKTSLIELKHGEDPLKLLEREGDSIALVLIGGVNYYTGQLFDMQKITVTGHKKGCIVGFDLAHAIGNVPLKLHDWQVDFAVWCHYKYLNSGPGSVAGCFIHDRHAKNPALPRFAGWWGSAQDEKFKMGPDFIPAAGAEGWQLSNAPVASMALVKASLGIFHEAGMEKIRAKSVLLTGYLEFLLKDLAGAEIMTPKNPEERGAQLSLRSTNGRKIFDTLTEAGVICDWREPGCIRIAPAPLYNSFMDVCRFAEILEKAL